VNYIGLSVLDSRTPDLEVTDGQQDVSQKWFLLSCFAGLEAGPMGESSEREYGPVSRGARLSGRSGCAEVP
jgi:hypothetical protein